MSKCRCGHRIDAHLRLPLRSACVVPGCECDLLNVDHLLDRVPATCPPHTWFTERAYDGHGDVLTCAYCGLQRFTDGRPAPKGEA